MNRLLFSLTLVATALICWPICSAAYGEDKPADEKDLRDRFFQTYTQAKTPKDKAKAVQILEGVKEKSSLKTISGMLGAVYPEVRLQACQVMAVTADPHGYFINPLIGGLSDKDPNVRIAAAGALGSVKLKGQAVKGLIYAYQSLAAKDEQPKDLMRAITDALKTLTGKKFGNSSKPKLMAAAWTTWWKENRERLEKADDTYRQSLRKEAQKKEAPQDKRALPDL